jgi:hypothetical protein
MTGVVEEVVGVLVQVKGWQRSFQPSMKRSMAARGSHACHGRGEFGVRHT